METPEAERGAKLDGVSDHLDKEWETYECVPDRTRGLKERRLGQKLGKNVQENHV